MQHLIDFHLGEAAHAMGRATANLQARAFAPAAEQCAAALKSVAIVEELTKLKAAKHAEPVEAPPTADPEPDLVRERDDFGWIEPTEAQRGHSLDEREAALRAARAH